MSRRVRLISIVPAIVMPLFAERAIASSVAITELTFLAAVARSGRVVEGRIVAGTPFRFQGKLFWSVELAVTRTLKGAPGPAKETVRAFDPAEWFRHSHAEAIRAGVISYAEPHYATPVKAGDLKPGAALILFLSREAVPPGFPSNAAFLLSAGAYERPERAKEILGLGAGEFDQSLRLAIGDRVLLPDGLRIVLKAHAHKRPMAGGPSKEMSELELTAGKRVELIQLGHIVEPVDNGRAREQWETRDWTRYRLELLQMKYDAETILRVRQRTP